MSGPTVNKSTATIPKLEKQMNIKRAFLAAIAVLMMPAYAMAQNTFPTTIEFTNGGQGSATATLTCNSGVPLQQSFQISELDGVAFVVAGMVAASDCEITITNLDGYTILAESNQVNTGSSCLFTDVAVGVGDEVDVCEFIATPNAFTYVVAKVWPADNINEISELATFTWTCFNVENDRLGNNFRTMSDSRTMDGNGSFSVSRYANPAGGSSCRTTESAFDSAVESDQGCASSISFAIGDTTKGCTITNTVFFEGIPTLSQYGMAIMALLMLAVGFVGFRRFV
jgi:hypothetical protein